MRMIALPILEGDWYKSGEFINSDMDVIVYFLMQPDVFEKHQVPVWPVTKFDEYNLLYDLSHYLSSNYSKCYAFTTEKANYMTPEDFQKYLEEQ